MVGSQSVFRWDDAIASWKILPSGQTLQPGSVLWLRSTHDGSLALLGNYSDPSNRVATASGSLVPSAGLEVWDLRATLSNTPSTTAWTFDNSIGGWLSWLIPPLGGSVNTAFLGPGAAAFMRTTAGAVLAAPSAALRVRRAPAGGGARGRRVGRDARHQRGLSY